VLSSPIFSLKEALICAALQIVIGLFRQIHVDVIRPNTHAIALLRTFITSGSSLQLASSQSYLSMASPTSSAALAPPQPAQTVNSNLAHLDPLPPSVFTLPQTAQLEALYTIIRNKETSRGDFLFYSDRIIRLLVEEGLNHLPVVARTVETPTVSSPPLKMATGSTGQLSALYEMNC
jgi:hypothetical protein